MASHVRLPVVKKLLRDHNCILEQLPSVRASSVQSIALHLVHKRAMAAAAQSTRVVAQTVRRL